MHYIQIQWTTDNEQKAKQIARHLIEKRLAACVNILPCMSLYQWEDKLCESNEVKVLIKTIDKHFKEIETILIEQGGYEVPEILCFPIIKGLQTYLDWMSAMVLKP